MNSRTHYFRSLLFENVIDHQWFDHKQKCNQPAYVNFSAS